MKINQFKLNRIIEYIKIFEFPFDIIDVTEDINAILSYYRISELLNIAETEFLKIELTKLAEIEQSREVRLLIKKSLEYAII